MVSKIKLIVGISGATGVEMGGHLLCALKNSEMAETHLIVTHGASNVLKHEKVCDIATIKSLADIVYDVDDLAASVSSGSYPIDGMVVLPCSMKSLSAIANGYDDNLLTRAAGVCLKEGRKVILCPRETPLSPVHLRNMLNAAVAGYVILPPMLTFYGKCDSVEDMVDHIIGKILQQFNIAYQNFRPWGN